MESLQQLFPIESVGAVSYRKACVLQLEDDIVKEIDRFSSRRSRAGRIWNVGIVRN